jgi:hypothetical protein
MTRKLLVLLLAGAWVVAVIPSAHAGPVSGKFKRSGQVVYYFTPGSAGTGIPWPEGGELDAPGDVGSLSATPGTEPHVALANTVFTFLLDMPITFQGGTFTKPTIVGGNATVTAYLAEPLSIAVMGFVEAQLFDVAPDGTAQQFAGIDFSSEKAWTAGLTEPERGTYTFQIPQKWEIPKNHHLRIELDFPFVGSALMRFFYGDATWAASIALDKYVRVK